MAGAPAHGVIAVHDERLDLGAAEVDSAPQEAPARASLFGAATSREREFGKVGDGVLTV
jgi:hypothetical protein